MVITLANVLLYLRFLNFYLQSTGVDFQHMETKHNEPVLARDMPSISVENLTCYRSGVSVFSGLSFLLNPGDHLLIRGSNGSGKTTLLRTLLSLTSRFDGTIQIPLDDTTYLGHLKGLKPELTVWENHRFWQNLNNIPPSRKLLHHFKLDDLGETPIKLLSEGQKRKVALAGALETGKKIWLLDEPFNSLDKEGQVLLAELIQDHCNDLGIIILTSHLEPITSSTQTVSLDDYR